MVSTLRTLVITCALACALAPFGTVGAQTVNIPVKTVSAPFTSKEHFTAVPEIRQLPGGRVLVNDSRNKRMIVFDSTLSTFTISADSLRTNGALYPQTLGSPMFPYLGDSTLLLDFESKAYVVIDGNGKFGRAMAVPIGDDAISGVIGLPNTPGTDAHGRIIYRASNGRPNPKPGDPPVTATRDTISIVRADFNTRSADTIGAFGVRRFVNAQPTIGADGKAQYALVVNPLPPGPDQWAVLADGTLAIVREHDYHVEYVDSENKKFSGAKLPFDWRRLTDDDKIARIDSMKRVIDSVNASGKIYGMMTRGTRKPNGSVVRDTVAPTISFTPIAEIPDYVSPISDGAVRADADGNVWILPTTSSLAGAGLVYDVVNKKGELFERVRLPANCVLAGFGKGGVVYVAKTEPATKTWVLERVRIVGPILK